MVEKSDNFSRNDYYDNCSTVHVTEKLILFTRV